MSKLIIKPTPIAYCINCDSPCVKEDFRALHKKHSDDSLSLEDLENARLGIRKKIKERGCRECEHSKDVLNMTELVLEE